MAHAEAANAGSPAGGYMPAPDTLDAYDKALLDIIQTGFPLTPRPYAELATQTGLTEQEAFERVEAMRKSRLIRRLGANFQSAKMGFRSTLCAARVPQEKLEAFIEDVNAQPGVTHNYLRKHNYNVWFSLIGPSWEDVLHTLDGLSQRNNIAILNLPATRVYKIRVDFNMGE